MKVVEASDALLVFDRSLESHRLRCSFNLSSGAVRFEPSGKLLLATAPVDDGSLGAYAALIEEV
jgi:alpha-glucosidase